MGQPHHRDLLQLFYVIIRKGGIEVRVVHQEEGHSTSIQDSIPLIEMIMKPGVVLVNG